MFLLWKFWENICTEGVKLFLKLDFMVTFSLKFSGCHFENRPFIKCVIVCQFSFRLLKNALFNRIFVPEKVLTLCMIWKFVWILNAKAHKQKEHGQVLQHLFSLCFSWKSVNKQTALSFQIKQVNKNADAPLYCI